MTGPCAYVACKLCEAVRDPPLVEGEDIFASRCCVCGGALHWTTPADPPKPVAPKSREPVTVDSVALKFSGKKVRRRP